MRNIYKKNKKKNLEQIKNYVNRTNFDKFKFTLKKFG